jgi:hypothetical protein
MWVIAPLYDEEGEVIYDYYCGCGKNLDVHLAECGGLTVPHIRMGKQKSIPFIENKWLLGTWLEPPNPQEWIAMDGTLDSYPHQGTYVPFQINGMTVNLHEDQWREIAIKTEKIVVAMKDYIAQRRALEEEAEKKRELVNWVPPKRPDGTLDLRDPLVRKGPSGSTHNRYYMQLRDKMTQFGQIPGQKGHVSWGGDPTIDSPNVSKEEKKIIIP